MVEPIKRHTYNMGRSGLHGFRFRAAFPLIRCLGRIYAGSVSVSDLRELGDNPVKFFI